MNDSLQSSNSSARGRWLVLIAAFLGWMFDGMEMGIHPLVVTPALKELIGNEMKAGGATVDPQVLKDAVNTWNGYTTSLFLLGAAGGGLVFGWLGDRIGRVRAMMFSILCYSGFTGLCYFAESAAQFGFLRFLAALGMGGEWSLGVALVMESWPQRHRPILAGAIGAAANVGFLLVGLLALQFRVTDDRWRWVLLVGAAPAALTVFIRLFVPESEKWKESAKGKPSRPLTELVQSGWTGRTVLAVALASVALVGTWGSVQQIVPWIRNELLTKEIASKQLAELSHESAAGASQSNVPSNPGLTTLAVESNLPADPVDGYISDAAANAQIALSVGAILGCLIGAFCGNWLGRRPTYFLLCVTSLGFCTFLFWFYKEVNLSFYAVVFAVGLFTAAFYGWLPLYLPELFPTRFRATGQGLAFNFGRVVAAFGAVYLGDITKAYGESGWAKACGTLTLVYAVGMILIWFAPETKGKPLPD
ncbi:MAG: MFS transporter [Planctomycetota bacterium]|nr:MFS transporter [Planctomycetota bacterium]